MVNHPNGLIDPLIVAVNNPRIQHFLVRAAVFKKPLVKKFLATLNLMPIYRIRDGVKELGKNQEIFEKCFSIFNEGKALMIFPEGGHNRKRTVRPLSKGFTRIVFGALEQNPDLKIQIVPVGITYQNSSVYPSKVTLNYGTPVLANSYFSPEDQVTKTRQLKELITQQLQQLSVHIPDDENYNGMLQSMNKANVDFTDVTAANEMIKTGKITGRKRSINVLAFLKPLIVLNTLIPWLLWKYVDKKNDEIEFVDTFRFGFNTLTFGLSYLLQSYIAFWFFGWKIALIYFACSLLAILLFSKLHPTPAELPLE